MKRIVFIIFLLLVTILAVAQQQLYVSSSATSKGNGTMQYPFLSLQDAINHACTNQTEETTIHILPGDYYISESININNKTSNKRINIEGSNFNTTRIIGGISIKGWKLYKKGIYRASVSHLIGKGKSIEQLYVNGRWAQLAHSPNEGYATVKGIDGMTMTFEKSSLSDLSGLTTEELQSVRFDFLEKWDVMKWIPGSVDTSKGIVKFKAGNMKPWNKIQAGTRCIIYNSPKSLDNRGEWYFDKEQGYIYYYPLDGEDMAKAEVIAPLTAQLFSIEGTETRPISNISLSNISFLCSSHLTPQNGDGPEQAAAHIEGALKLNYANNINIHDCDISLTGGYGIEIGAQCHADTINHCLLSNLGAGGIKVGLMSYKKGQDITSGIVIENNKINSLGQWIANGAGILVMNACNNKIIHNDISDVYYTGISLGWTWGFNDETKYNPAINNYVAYNKIYNVGKGVLSDLAGIYTLGESPGTRICNNVIHDINCYDYGGFGIYADEGSSDITISNNLVYNCSTGTFEENYGKDNTITNNIFAFGGEYQLHLVKTSEGSSFKLTNNIIVYKTGRTLSGSMAWIERGKFTMDSNLYWHINGKLDLATLSLKDWKSYQDKHSIEADPMFKDPENGNFLFRSTAVAKRIGFKPFDYTKAGVPSNMPFNAH